MKPMWAQERGLGHLPSVLTERSRHVSSWVCWVLIMFIAHSVATEPPMALD